MKLLPASLAVLALMGGLSSGVQAQAQARRTYIVQLAAEPAASYTGNVAGYAATQPVAGARFNARSAAALNYKRLLDNQQNTVVALVAKAPIVARYTIVYNGFAARLTDAEVAALRASPLVVEVHADEARKLETVSTPTFLGLTAPGGLWSQAVDGISIKGEDIVIGIVDGGVWPESPSYADRVDAGTGLPSSSGTQVYGPPSGNWLGVCETGEGFAAKHCNNKLIGARFFNAGFQSFLATTGAINAGNVKHWTEFYSPRDSVAGATGHGGHGSHTSSTAGGNSNAPVVLNGVSMGGASGMAPRARIAAYKVCWTYVDATATDGTGTRNSCFTSDSVSAIDRAVADGVHVINYSISGSQTSVNDPVEQAFLRAANAGVFVAASAGNSGPGVAVAHVSPWLTTVAASTHDRSLKGTVTLGNAASYTGASINTTPVPATQMILSTDAKAATASTSDANLCFLSSGGAPTLDPTLVAGKVVICTRGSNARVDKSAAVKAAGGVGMILVDNGAGLVADVHSVPSVHVNATDGAAITTYLAGSSPATAAIGAFFNGSKPAPLMASFSSRGPNQGDANMLKPDLTAPGVDVIATVTPGLSEAQRDAVAAGTMVPPPEWASYQGTSMSSPHVAGLAALLKQAHPKWSPAAIKSALMTTAFTTLNDGQAGEANGLLPWAQGAGHVAPNMATNPGLVYDAGRVDYIRYQCKVNKAAVTPASDCTTYGTLDETYNFNQASITVGSVFASVTVTRKVTNVGSSPAVYNATAAVPGFTALVTPASLSLAPGETKSFTLKLTPTTAVANQWNYGALSWTDGTHVVNSPVTAKTGKPISAPALLTGTTTSGTRLITINTGISGRISANKGGMKNVTMGALAALTPAATTRAALKTICTTGVDTAAVKVYPVNIPAGTIVARFALRDADVGAVGDDNDMMLLLPSGADVYSGNDGSNEEVKVSSPEAGSYKVCVVAYGGAASMTHRLSSWVVTAADASSTLNVLLPGAVFSGSTATVGVAWSGLAAGGRYVGGFQLKDPGGVVQSTTAVQVDTAGAAPLAKTARAVSTKQLAK
jgi:subtilisin family serine protease